MTAAMSARALSPRSVGVASCGAGLAEAVGCLDIGGSFLVRGLVGKRRPSSRGRCLTGARHCRTVRTGSRQNAVPITAARYLSSGAPIFTRSCDPERLNLLTGRPPAPSPVQFTAAHPEHCPARSAVPQASLAHAKAGLSGRQEIGDSRRWPPSTSPVPIFTASGTTRSNQATLQRQRLIPDNPLRGRFARDTATSGAWFPQGYAPGPL